MPELRPYQQQGVRFLRSRSRALLADEMQLGKSAQVIRAIRSQTKGRVLVVAPGNAIGVWQDEIAQWAGQGSSVFAGSKPDPDILDGSGWILTTYKRLEPTLVKPWAAVVFDESQMLKNRKSRTLFLTVKRLLDAPLVYFLSGTPMPNGASDLWTVLHLIDRQQYSSYWRFVNKYAIVEHDLFGWKVEGVVNAKKLWEELSKLALRRLKRDVRSELPAKQRTRILLDMSPKQAKLYRAIANDMYYKDEDKRYRLIPSKLAMTTRLRQCLVSPRLLGIDDDGAAIPALVEELELNPRALLIFTPFAAAIPLITGALPVPSFVLKGGMTPRQLKTNKEAFKAAKGPAALVATVQMGTAWNAGGKTSEVVFIGYDWRADRQVQAEDRAEGGGPIAARYFVHRDSLDRHVLSVVAGKLRLSDAVLNRQNVLGPE